MVYLLSEELKRDELYGLITSVVVPRPIAWVTTIHENGAVNLAPFSFFSAISSNPPRISISVVERRSSEHPGFELKDTALNLRREKACVIHMVDEEMLTTMHQSAAEYARGVSESEVLRLGLEPAMTIRGYRLSKANIAMECIVEDEHIYQGIPDVHLFVLRIISWHVPDITTTYAHYAQQGNALTSFVARIGSGGYVNMKNVSVTTLSPSTIMK